MIDFLKIEKYLFHSFTAVVGISLFIPLLFIKDILRPYIVGKMIPFQVLVLILAVIWAILMALDWKKYRPKINILTVSLAIFVFIVLLSSIFGQNFYRSFWGNAERMDGFLALFHFFIFFLAVSSVFREKPEIFKKLIFLSLFVSCLCALWPLLQKWGLAFNPPGEKFDRPPGTFGNPTFLSGYLLIHLFLGAWYLFKDWVKSKKIKPAGFFVIGFSLINLIGLFWTQTRGSWLGLILGLLVFLFAGIFIFPKKTKIYLGSALLVLILAGAGFWGLRNQIKGSSLAKKIPIIERIANISLEDSSARARFVSWKWSLDWFWQKPVLGVGQDMFYSVFDKNYNPDNFNLSHERFDRSHNKFIDVLVMNGLIGFISYLFFLFSIFWLLGKKIKRAKDYFSKSAWLAVISLFVAHIVHIFFVFETPGNSLILFFLLAWIAIDFSSDHLKNKESGDNNHQKIKEKNSSSKKISVLVVSFVLAAIIAIFVFYQTDYKPYQAAKLSFEAASGNPLDFAQISKYYNLALAQKTFLSAEIRKMEMEHFFNFAIYAVRSGMEVDNKFILNYINNLDQEMNRGLEHENMIDFYVYPATTYAQLSWKEGISDEDRSYYYSQMVSWFNRLKSGWPLRSDYYIVLAENYFFRQEFEKAEILTDEILALTPKFGRAVFLKGAFSVLRGNWPTATGLLAQAAANGYSAVSSTNADILNPIVAIVGKDNWPLFLDYFDQSAKELFSQKSSQYDYSLLAELGVELHLRMKSSNWQKLGQYLEERLSLYSDRADYWARLAAIYGKLKNKEKAIYCAQMAAQKDPATFSTSSKIFINLVENELWDQLP